MLGCEETAYPGLEFEPVNPRKQYVKIKPIIAEEDIHKYDFTEIYLANELGTFMLPDEVASFKTNFELTGKWNLALDKCNFTEQRRKDLFALVLRNREYAPKRVE